MAFQLESQQEDQNAGQQADRNTFHLPRQIDVNRTNRNDRQLPGDEFKTRESGRAFIDEPPFQTPRGPDVAEIRLPDSSRNDRASQPILRCHQDSQMRQPVELPEQVDSIFDAIVEHESLQVVQRLQTFQALLERATTEIKETKIAQAGDLPHSDWRDGPVVFEGGDLVEFSQRLPFVVCQVTAILQNERPQSRTFFQLPQVFRRKRRVRDFFAPAVGPDSFSLASFGDLVVPEDRHGSHVSIKCSFVKFPNRLDVCKVQRMH